MEFFKFWVRALLDSLSWGWVVFCVVSTAMPALLTLLQHNFPKLAAISWIKTITEYQAEIQVVIALIFVIPYLAYAPYSLYKKKADHARRLETQVDKSRPKLNGTIEFVFSGNMTPKGSNNPVGAMVLVLVGIRNTGTPSVAEAWHVHIQSEKLNLDAAPTFIPPLFEVRADEGKITLHGSEALYEKTNKPIANGSTVRGWLMFQFEGVSANELQSKGTKIEISFVDVLGAHYVATYPVAEGQQGLYYFPGSEQPFSGFEGRFSTPPSPTPDTATSPH
jgi:hypothetical protein